MRKLILMIVCVAVLSLGCNSKLKKENAELKAKIAELEKKLNPDIPKSFKENLKAFTDIGLKIVSNSSRGVTYSEFRDMLMDARAGYDKCKITWPKSIPEKQAEGFTRAITAWDFTVELWSNKIGKKDEPTEPNINGYQALIEFAEPELIISTHDNSFIVRDYRGKKYLPFDENISALLTIASNSFAKSYKQIDNVLE